MLPVSADKLSFLKIADYWSLVSPCSQDKLLAGLEAAWWMGEITGNSARSRLQFLRIMYQSRHDLQSVVFVTPNDAGPPTETPLPDGGFLVDLTPRIPVPAETEDWTESSCNAAFEELARLPSQQYFPLLSYSICFIELTPEEFFGWVSTRGFEVPKFWKRTAKASQTSPQGEGPSNNSPSSPKPQRRLAEANIEHEFKSWREGQPDGYIPTATEDIAHMRQLGVSRERVRDLRKKLPRRKRGQKRFP